MLKRRMAYYVQADTAADLQSLGKARAIVSKFGAWLRRRNENTVLGECGLYKGIIDNVVYWTLPVTLLGFQYRDLDIGIGWSSNRDIRGSVYTIAKAGKPHYIAMVYVHENPEDKVDVAWGLHWDSMIHELVHYFDKTRGTNPAVDKRLITKFLKTGETQPSHDGDYYNNPLEFNAHYIQMLEKFVAALVYDVRHAPERNAKRTASFAAFLREFEGFAPKLEFKNALEGKYRRKYLKRIHALYDYVKNNPEMPNIQAIAYGE